MIEDKRTAVPSRLRVAIPLLGMLSAFSVPLQAADAAVDVVGAAYSMAHEKLLYKEMHCSSDDALTRQVVYRDAQGELLARKTLDYRTGEMTPSYVQHSFNAQPSIAVELGDNGIATTVWQGRDRTDSETVTTALAGAAPLVIDAGFDTLVIKHWDALVAGEQQQFYFPVVGRDDLVQLRIAAATCSYASETDQCFQLEIDNWLLRLIVDPIELGYSVQYKRLTRYLGLSNMGSGEGDGWIVDIRYSYDELPQLTCS